MHLNDQNLIQALLGELRYVHSTGDVRDSEKNSAELRRDAARRLGFANYADYCAGMDQQDEPRRLAS